MKQHIYIYSSQLCQYRSIDRSIDLVVGVLIWIDYTTYPPTLYATTVGGGGTTAEAASQNISEHISRR